MVQEESKSRLYEVPAEEDGARLDRLVAVLAGVSRKEARQMIGSGRVLLKKKPAKILSKRLKAGSVLEIRGAPVPMEAKKPAAPRTHAALDVLYLDHEIIVVNH